VTIELSLIGIAAGLIIGLILGLIRTIKSRVLIVPKLIAICYVESFRRVPLILLILFSFYLLAITGFKVSTFFVASFAISIYSGAYMAENIRAGIEAIRPQQWDAAKALGLTTFQEMFYIILPQAIRVIIPPTIGFSLGLVKDTSLASIIEVVDITYAASIIRYKTAESFSVFGAVMLLYFVVCFPLSRLGQYAERRFRVT
jgi:polar amino acid transport system permease protein